MWCSNDQIRTFFESSYCVVLCFGENCMLSPFLTTVWLCFFGQLVFVNRNCLLFQPLDWMYYCAHIAGQHIIECDSALSLSKTVQVLLLIPGKRGYIVSYWKIQFWMPSIFLVFKHSKTVISVRSAQVVLPSQSPLLVDFEAIVTSKWTAVVLLLPLPRWLCFQFVCLSVHKNYWTDVFPETSWRGGAKAKKEPIMFWQWSW